MALERSATGSCVQGKAHRRSLGFAPNDKPETGALSAAYPTQAQRQGLTPISCHAVLERSGCAPFIKERRMKCIHATGLRRKSGQMGHPNLRCRCRRQGHCSLNLLQARRLRGTTRFKSVSTWGWLFGWKGLRVVAAERETAGPLRYAPVGMTKFGVPGRAIPFVAILHRLVLSSRLPVRFQRAEIGEGVWAGWRVTWSVERLCPCGCISFSGSLAAHRAARR